MTTPTFCAFFCGDLVMKIFLLPFFLSRLFKKSSCSLIAKECTLTTSKMPPGGLPRNTMFRITDQPNMTSAVYRGCECGCTEKIWQAKEIMG